MNGTKEIIRTQDEKALEMVKNNKGVFCPKSEWKKNIRDKNKETKKEETLHKDTKTVKSKKTKNSAQEIQNQETPKTTSESLTAADIMNSATVLVERTTKSEVVKSSKKGQSKYAQKKSGKSKE